MVRAVFRPEAVLTLFLRLRTKGITKLLGKYMLIEEILPCNRCRRSEWQGQIFDRKLLNSRVRTMNFYYFDLTTVQINKCNKTANINVKKTFSLKL